MSNELVISLINNIATLAIPIVLFMGFTWIRAWMIKRGYKTDVVDAVQRAAGIGYSYLLTNNIKITDPGAIKAAVEAGTQYLAESNTLLAKLPTAGIDPAHLPEMVHAEFGKLVAADPATSISEAPKAQVINNVVAAVESSGEAVAKNLETKVSAGA